MTGSAADVASAIRERHSFILTSHARPDGDAVGSQIALALALDDLGKTVRVVDRDPVPAPYRVFPGTDRIEFLDRVTWTADAVIALECPSLERAEVAGLQSQYLINVDHHLGNTLYGATNWFDESAAACGEMVADVIDALGVAWTPAIASHLFLAIATDTGGFRHGHITARTFDLCRRIAGTGVDPAGLSRQIFDSYSIGRVKLTGALLDAMELYHDDRFAVLAFDDELLAKCGASADDTDGLVNLPLGALDIVAVALFKRQADASYRVSLRSKGHVDVRAVAMRWGGGGHTNASGCTCTGTFEAVKEQIVDALGEAILRAAMSTSVAAGPRERAPASEPAGAARGEGAPASDRVRGSGGTQSPGQK